MEWALCFDTFKSSDDLDEFVWHSTFANGAIVIAACKDDCVKHLSSTAEKWFFDMGSKEIMELKYRHSFAFIGVIGQKSKVQEKRATNTKQMVQITQIFKIKVADK